MRGMGPTSQPADTADRILRAADELFAARGYAGVSVRDIAEQAGVNKGLVYYHHGSKAELFERLLDGYYRRHADALSDGFDHGGSLRERLHSVMDAYLDFLEENHRYAQLVQREIAAGSEAIPQIRRGLSLLYEWLAENLATVCPPDGPLAARHFFVSFSGIAVTYYVYAPAIEPLWGDDPMSVKNRRQRREHLHWMVDVTLDRLESLPVSERAGRAPPRRATRRRGS